MCRLPKSMKTRCSNLTNFNYKPLVESRQQRQALCISRHLRLIAIMIEVTSRRRSALILTRNTVRCLLLRYKGIPYN